MSDPDDKVVTFGGRPRPDPEKVKAFTETARRLQRERATANDTVAQILDATPRQEWPSLAEKAELRNSGALEYLAVRLRARCEKDPQEALAVSSLATTVAETLPADSYPPVTLAQLRAQAWKDRAHTLRYLGRYDEAFDAIAAAERALQPFPATAYDKAVVGLVKASTLQHVEKYGESRVLLAECREVFRDHGDHRRYIYCGIAEVALLFREKKYTEAHAVGAELLTRAIEANDLESAARLHNNIGNCDVHLGNLSEANKHLATAKAIFVDLGKPIEATRCEAGFGKVLLSKGHYKEGMDILQSARTGLVAHSLIEEAGICGLIAAAAMLENHNAASAQQLVQTIIDDFTIAGLSQRAVRAVQYLADSIATGTASPATAQHVEEYVAGLRLDPSTEFLPLPASGQGRHRW